VGRYYLAPGTSIERCNLFLAEIAHFDGTGGGLASEGEMTARVSIPLTELAALADDGLIVDMKTALLVNELRRRKPHLFV
jgi:hypothetical protein